MAVLADGATPLVGATVVLHGDPTRATSTDATGAFALCAPQAQFTVDVDGTALDGSIVEAAYNQQNGLMFPVFSASHLASVMTAAGQTADPTKGTVIVLQQGADTLDLAAAHGATLGQGANPPWSAAATDYTLMYPNVDPGPTMISRFADGTTMQLTAAPEHITWVHLPHIEL